jgi:thioredoxin 1
MIIIKEAAEFEKVISQKGVVYFYAQWCGPCKVFGPKLEENSKAFNNIKFGKVDVEEPNLEDVVVDYGIRAMPTVIAFQDGKEIAREIGVIQDISGWIKETFE